METVNASDVKSLIAKAHATLCVALHALDTKVLVGEINRPSDPVIKTKRKRRTKKEIEALALQKMDLEKEYQAGRTPMLLSDAYKEIENLPEDKDPFFAKTKKERKERKKKEKKVPVEP